MAIITGSTYSSFWLWTATVGNKSPLISLGMGLPTSSPFFLWFKEGIDIKILNIKENIRKQENMTVHDYVMWSYFFW